MQQKGQETLSVDIKLKTSATQFPPGNSLFPRIHSSLSVNAYFLVDLTV